MRRWMIATLAAALVATSAIAAGAATVHTQRSREWAHGGDDLKVEVEVVLATPETFNSVTTRLGVPPSAATRNTEAQQVVVARVRWSGQPDEGHSLQLIMLDGRLAPPRLLAADAGWNAAGATGSQWSSAYESLAEHYDWLAGVAATNYTDALGQNRLPSAAISAGSGHSGTATGWFWQWEDAPIPFTDPARDVVVALVDVDDDGEVRWARRVSG